MVTEKARWQVNRRAAPVPIARSQPLIASGKWVYVSTKTSDHEPLTLISFEDFASRCHFTTKHTKH